MTDSADMAGERVLAELEEIEFWEGASALSATAIHLKDDSSSSAEPRIYDLEERTARFGESVIRFAKRIPETSVNRRIISQLVGAAISVGANYCEADDASSKKEFRQKIGYSRKEAREARFHLRMVVASEPQLKDDPRILWREARELHLIFCATLRTSENNT